MSYFKISGSPVEDSAAALAAASGVGGYIAYVQGGVTILGGIAALVLTLVTARYWWTRTKLLTKTTEAEQKRLDDYRDFVVSGGDASNILEKILSDEKLLKALQEALDRA